MLNSPIIVAGGTGYLGNLLKAHYTAKNIPVVILTRRDRDLPSEDGVTFVPWDGINLAEWADHISGARAVINLSGRTVNTRYSEKNKREIYRSRLLSTQVLGRAIAQCVKPPPVWLNGSSATIYRHAEDRPMDEYTGELGSGFSVDVCQKWELALDQALTPQTRKVALRTAMVFGAERGGVFDRLAQLVSWGLGGQMGNGRQYVSWIHDSDFTRAVDGIINNPDLQGVINISSPFPLPNCHFMKILREEIGMPLGLPSARWMLELGALVFQTETELILKSRRVIPSRLLESGFVFRFPRMREAVREILGARKTL